MLRFFITSKIEHVIVHTFITFMVVSRCMRALVKVLKVMRGEKQRKRMSRRDANLELQQG